MSIRDQLESPEWWFTVVVAATIVGLLVTWLQRRIDSFLARWSKQRRRREDERRTALLRDATAISRDSHRQIMLVLEVLERRVASLWHAPAMVIGGSVALLVYRSAAPLVLKVTSWIIVALVTLTVAALEARGARDEELLTIVRGMMREAAHRDTGAILQREDPPHDGEHDGEDA